MPRLIGIWLTMLALLTACGPRPAASAPTSQPPAPTLPAAQPPTAAPPATRTPTSSQTFTSSRFGYSLSLPGEWYLTEKPGKWNGKLSDESGDAGTDLYARPFDSFPPLEVAVVPVKSGTTTEQWAQSEADKTTFPDCRPSTSLYDTTAGGDPAKLQKIHCQIYTITNVFVVHGGKGYLFSWGSEGNAPPEFTAALTSLKFP